MSDLIERLARPEILALLPADVSGGPLPGTVRLDANENPFAALVAGQAGLNRYPDPQPQALRCRMADLYGVAPERLWITRGSDDAIDLLIRSFCQAGVDSVGIVEPTFSAYAQFARVQGAVVRTVRLGPDFRFDQEAVIASVGSAPPSKLLFLCTPNNPTGSEIDPAAIRAVAAALPETIVVVDEAYGEFATAPSIAGDATGNLVVLRTLSKAYGLAGARIGCLIGSPEVVALVSRVSPPYPLPVPSIAAALAALGPERMMLHRQRISDILFARSQLAQALSAVVEIRSIREGGNFLFVEVDDPAGLERRLRSAAVRVRFRPNASAGGVRITVGTDEENAALLAVFGIASGKPTRTASIVRDTRETRIALALDLDSDGPRSISTGIGFYDHMLDQVAAHGGFALTLSCDGDSMVDAHHSVEDVAIALGSALREALGDKRGVARFGFALPLDEASGRVLIDLSGRPFAKFEGEFETAAVGDLPTQMVPHVFRSLADSLGAAIHVEVTGDNDHHKVEAAFKAFGRALRQALSSDGHGIPSTKGML